MYPAYDPACRRPILPLYQILQVFFKLEVHRHRYTFKILFVVSTRRLPTVAGQYFPPTGMFQSKNSLSARMSSVKAFFLRRTVFIFPVPTY